MSNDNGAVKTEEKQSTPSGKLDEVAGLLTASLDSMTPALVQRMVTTMAQLAEMIDLVEILNTDEMKSLLERAAEVAASLERSLGAIQDLEESGALNTLTELAGFAVAMKSSMTSSILTRSLSDLALPAAEMGATMLETARDAKYEAAKDTRKLGPVALLSALKDPQMQESLKFLLAMGKRLPNVLESL